MVRAALCCALRSATLMWIACCGGDYLSAPVRAFGPTFEYRIPTQMFCRAFLGAEPHPSPHPAPPPQPFKRGLNIIILCRLYYLLAQGLLRPATIKHHSSSSQSDNA